MKDITAISARHQHQLALRKDGTVWGWGNNATGQVGDGTAEDRNRPIQVVGLAEITSIAAGGHFSIALKKDGTVWSWGGITWKGDSPPFGKPLPPVQVPVLADISGVAAGYQGFLALKKDETVWGWGTWTFFGEAKQENPAAIDGLKDVAAIASGFFHALVLKKDGTLWSLGWNSMGQLGDGTTTDKHIPLEGGKERPIQIPGVDGIRAIAAGSVHSLVIQGH